MATVIVPASTREAHVAPTSYDIGYKIRCRRCGYVQYERVLSEVLERRCPTGCGAIVCVSACLLSQAIPVPSEQELLDLALWQSEAEQKEGAPATRLRSR